MSLNLHWSADNAKLLKTATVSFGIPAFRAADGFVTCPGAGACANFCFARNGWYSTPRVKGPRERNLAAVRRGFEGFVRSAVEDLARLTRRFVVVRVHDSGDFFSQGYLDAWYRIADHFPRRRFYAYTKSLHLDLFTDRPRNFALVQSQGGKFDARLREDIPQARIFRTVAELERSGWASAHESDAPAINEEPRVGLVYHGMRRRMDSTLMEAMR